MSKIAVTAMQVTNTTGHYKYYRIYVAGRHEIRQWGKIGTRGQSKRYLRLSANEAIGSARTKIEEEIGKGYSGKDIRYFEMDEADLASTTNLMTEWHRAQSNIRPVEEDEILYDDDEPDPRVQRLLWDKEPA